MHVTTTHVRKFLTSQSGEGGTPSHQRNEREGAKRFAEKSANIGFNIARLVKGWEMIVDGDAPLRKQAFKQIRDHKRG
jgi:hypothetical protein